MENKLLTYASLAILMIFLVLAVTGCDTDKEATRQAVIQTQQVDVPILEKMNPPVILKRPATSIQDLPVFVSPTDKTASSCLTAEGEAKFRALVNGRENLLDGWEAYGFNR